MILGTHLHRNRRTTTGDFGLISRYPKNKRKGGPQYVVSALFLVKISKGKIGTANPPFSANAKRLD